MADSILKPKDKTCATCGADVQLGTMEFYTHDRLISQEPWIWCPKCSQLPATWAQFTTDEPAYLAAAKTEKVSDYDF